MKRLGRRAWHFICSYNALGRRDGGFRQRRGWAGWGRENPCRKLARKPALGLAPCSQVVEDEFLIFGFAGRAITTSGAIENGMPGT